MVTIYALCEPETRAVRYVGKTGGPPETRFRQHNKAGAAKKNTHLGCWLRSLRNQGEKPVLMVLTEVPDEIGATAEILYIRLAREGGMDLVNSTDGGEGIPMTPGIRAKISATLRGVLKSLESRAKNSAAKKGVPNSPSHCAAISAATRGEKNPMFGRLGRKHPLFGKKLSGASSRYVGVYWASSRSKWVARWPQGNHLGYFNSEADAHNAVVQEQIA